MVLVAQLANVLVFDDIHDVAAQLLTLFGHDVRVAYSAEDALTELRTYLPSVVPLELFTD
jgi:hypothetical protein